MRRTAPRHPTPVPARERRRVIALFLAFAGFYLLFASGHFYATDEETIYTLTERMVDQHTLTLPSDAWGLATTSGRDGRQYAVTGPGQSLLAIPFFLFGTLTAPLLPIEARGYATRFAVALFNPIVTAATVALLYALLRRLGQRGAIALSVAAIYGLATTAWPHGRTFFAEPLTALLLLAAWYCFRRGTEEPAGRGWLVAGGAALIAALSVKPHAALALPFMGLYLLVRATNLGRVAGVWQWRWRRGLVLTSYAGLGGMLIMMPLGLYNWALFGSPWQTGYGGQSAGSLFVTPLATGLYGLTIATGKGLIWYSPPFLLAIAGWWPFWRRYRAEGLLCLGLVTAHFLFYAQVFAWHGDGSWGPRYLMVCLPFAIVPLAGLLDSMQPRAWGRILVGGVVVWGIAVQLLGVSVNFDWYILRSNEQERHFLPAASPLVAHAQYLGERISLWRGRLFPAANSAVLVRGFAAAEPAANRPNERPGIFPRWTTGAGVVAIHPATHDPLTVKLTFFDHRPTALRTTRPVVLVDGVPVADGALASEDLTGNGEGWIDQFTVPGSAWDSGQVTITLQSATWNPHALGLGERDELLGVFVHNIEVWQAGQSLTIHEALPLDPMPQTPRQRFWWYNDDRGYWETRQHLVDHWGWYLAVAGFPRASAIAWAVVYGGISTIFLVAGLVLGRSTLPGAPARSVAPPRRRRRRNTQRARYKPRSPQ